MSPSVSDGHLLNETWTRTATNPTTNPDIPRGNPITLTYGVVPDGTDLGISRVTGETATDTSSMVSFLNTTFGSSAVWQPLIDSAYQRWGQVSGLTMIRETADDGAAMPNNSGTLGTRADMRIGGRSFGGSSVLAYNFFPTAGDMVVDTGDGAFYGNTTNNYLRFRNTLAHEIGHGLGMLHPESSTNRFLMEPVIDLNFDGPQHSDILAIQRGYGDAYEKGTGNDTSANATSLGNAATFTGIGLDGDNTTVAASNVDFVSIDGTTDTDFYSITLAEDGQFDVILESLGLTYQIQEQGNAASSITVDTRLLNNLALALLGTDGTTVLATSAAAPLGQTESILGQMLIAGTYFIRVTGSDDRAQFYSLATNFAAIPEPGSALLLCASSIGLLIRRRRK